MNEYLETTQGGKKLWYIYRASELHSW